MGVAPAPARRPDAAPVPPLVPDAVPPPPAEPDAAVPLPLDPPLDAAALPVNVADAGVEAPPRPHPWVESMTRGIRDVVEAHRDLIEDCYRRAAKEWTRDEPLAGRIDVHLTIVASGDAEDVRVVDNDTGSEALGTCLVALMRSWRYPAPGDDAMEFIWPFNFQAPRRGAGE